ncbi:hypothetical protein BC940DRAFT_291568 [Gongronella butleri]|nr:hypothetical protein BC940DRAFT_291568 [Gongronella butleri]
MYSPDLYEILSEIVSVSCVSMISLVFGRKMASIDGPVRYVRGLLLTLYAMSWAFVIIACMATSTNNGNMTSCLAGFYNVVFLHTVVKVVLYLYFIEKAYMLSVPKTKRLATPLYLCQLGMLVPFAVMIALMVALRTTLLGADFPFQCSFGFQMPAVVASLAYDALINLLFAGQFFRSVFAPSNAQQTSHQSSSLHVVAKRHGILALVSMVLSALSYAIYVLFNDLPRGLMPLTVATLDVCICSCMAQWATAHPADHQLLDKLLQPGNGDKPVKLEIKQHQEVVVLTEHA